MLKHSALLVVDMQNDFVDPQRGTLYVKDSENIVGIIRELRDGFTKIGCKVMYCGDAHEPEDEEFAQFPAHCVKGTWGQALVSDLRRSEDEILVEKQKFSVFSVDYFSNMMKDLGIDRIFMVGVATDICVRNSAVDALQHKFKVTVIIDATKSKSLNNVQL